MDNYNERIEPKIFHAEIIVGNAKVAAATKAYKKNQEILSYKDEKRNDKMKAMSDTNYRQVKQEALQIIMDEMARIENDRDLQHLIKR